MKTYTILLARDVPYYGRARITAATNAEAIAAARAIDLIDVCQDADWSGAVCNRIVHIEDSAGRIVAESIALDGCFLRYGGEADRVLCEAAPALLAALTRIAAIPLWGEAIDNEQLREEFLACGEYDGAQDMFTPSCDTESSYLRDAVEAARAAIAEIRGGP